MNFITTKIKDLINNNKIKQVAFLYSSMIVGLFVSFGNSIINTRFLDPEQYGDLSYLMHLFNFVVSFLTLGVFASGSRLLAKNENKDRTQNLIGILFIYSGIISVFMIAGFYFYSFYHNEIYNNNLGHLIQLFSPLLFIFPFKLCLEAILIGSNNIYKLSIFRILPKITYLLVALLLNTFWFFSLKAALLTNFLTISILLGVVSYQLKPEFKQFKKTKKQVIEEEKSHGFHLYLSYLANTGTVLLAGLIIAYYIDNVNVGYYSLALSVTAPLVMIPNAVGTTLFKFFANRTSLPAKTTVLTVVISLLSYVLFTLLIKKIFFVIYPDEYSRALSIIYVFALGAIIHGLADYLNMFLASQGKGKIIRNGAFIIALSNVVGYSVLIRFWGLDGIVFTRFFADLLYLLIMTFIYRISIQSNVMKVVPVNYA